ncbi:MAG: hypothetical protein AB2L11_08035 [Syntrophobacteraceae bacterium]
MKTQSTYDPTVSTSYVGRRKRMFCRQTSRSGMPASLNDSLPIFRIPELYRWTGLTLLLLALALTPGCHNRPSGPPPNPVIGGDTQQGSQSFSSPPSSFSTSSPSSAPSSFSSSSPRPGYQDFPDIPVPTEMSRLDKDCFVFQSGTLKAGLLTLKGTRVDVNSLINFFQTAMPRDNWKPKGGFHAQRTVLIFEKPDKTCVINLYEKLFRTYVEIYVAPASGQPLSRLSDPEGFAANRVTKDIDQKKTICRTKTG